MPDILEKKNQPTKKLNIKSNRYLAALVCVKGRHRGVLWRSRCIGLVASRSPGAPDRRNFPGELQQVNLVYIC